MPTPDLTTYKLVHDLSKGPELGSADGISGYMVRLPSILYAGDSFGIELVVYELYSATSPIYCDWPADGVTLSAKLYVKHADTVEDPVLVSTGTITAYATKRCQMNFTVYKDGIPANLAGATPVVLLFQVIDTTSPTPVQCSIFQRLSLTDHNGTATASLVTRDIDVSVIALTASATLTAYRGEVRYTVAPAAAPVVITLPALTTGVPQEIIITCISATYATTIPGTFNGAAGTIALGLNQTVHLFSDGTSWYNLNYGVSISA